MTENHPEPNLHKDIPPGLHIMNHVYRCIDTWCQYKHVIRRANLILCYHECQFNLMLSGVPTTRPRATTSSASTTANTSLLFTTTSSLIHSGSLLLRKGASHGRGHLLEVREDWSKDTFFLSNQNTTHARIVWLHSELCLTLYTLFPSIQRFDWMKIQEISHCNRSDNRILNRWFESLKQTRQPGRTTFSCMYQWFVRWSSNSSVANGWCLK